MKKYIALILSCMLVVAQCSLVLASETEQYEMVEMNNDVFLQQVHREK